MSDHKPTAIEAARVAGEPVYWCGGCLTWKVKAGFAQRKGRKGNRASRCKACVIGYNAAYRLRHPESVGRINPATRAAWHERITAKYRALAALQTQPEGTPLVQPNITPEDIP